MNYITLFCHLDNWAPSKINKNAARHGGEYSPSSAHVHRFDFQTSVR